MAKGYPKSGGRKKGVPNRNTKPLWEKAQELNIDPFEIMLLFAKGDWKALGYNSSTVTRYSASGDEYEIDRIEPEVRLKAASDASQYLFPKRKALEVSGPEGEDLFQSFTDMVKRIADEDKK